MRAYLSGCERLGCEGGRLEYTEPQSFVIFSTASFVVRSSQGKC